ncbi:MAG: sulfatase [Planctomycetes bacterium]|nr:sulfatase [Planctomycetota bacterium]
MRRPLLLVAVIFAALAAATSFEIGCGARHPGRPMESDVVAVDLVDALAHATITQNECAPVTAGVLFTGAKRLEGVEKGGERPAIVAAPPSKIVFRQTVEKGERLAFAAGLDFDWPKDAVGSIRFRVTIGSETIFDHSLDHSTSRSGDWVDARVDLERFAGRDVTIAFETSTDAPSDGPTLSAGWGSPRILRSTSIDRTVASRDAPNVLVVVIDTLRADAVHAFGCPIEATPALDSLAARGIRYDRALSASSWTWPATSSILTALYPFAHGVRRAEQCYLSDSITTIAEHFQSNGITTAAFSANSFICGAQNFGQGFETFQEFPEVGQRGRPVATAFGRWLEDRHDARFFAYVHLMDPHYPYTPLPEWLDRVRGGHRSADDDRVFQEIATVHAQPGLQKFREQKDLLRIAYEADVLEADQAVAGMLESLRLWHVDDRTIVVVTSDHGEEFFEHGGVGHARTLYEELIHVPLIIVDPRAGAARVSESVETMRLFPTLCTLANVPVPRSIASVAALPPFGPATTSEPVAFSTTDKWETQRPMFRTQSAIRTPEWMLWVAPKCSDPDWEPPKDDPNATAPELPEMVRLFHLSADPGEQTDVAASEPDRVKSLYARLEKWRVDTEAQSPKRQWSPSRQLLERLNANPYFGGGGNAQSTPTGSTPPKDDPPKSPK